MSEFIDQNIKNFELKKSKYVDDMSKVIYVYDKYYKDEDLEKLDEKHKQNKLLLGLEVKKIKFILQQKYKDSFILDTLEDLTFFLTTGKTVFAQYINEVLTNQINNGLIFKDVAKAEHWRKEYVYRTFLTDPIAKGVFSQNYVLNLLGKDNCESLIKNFIDKNQYNYVSEILKTDILECFVDKSKVVEMLEKNKTKIQEQLSVSNAESIVLHKDLEELKNIILINIGLDSNNETINDLDNMLQKNPIRDFASKEEERQAMQSVYSVEYANSVLGPKEPVKQITQNQVLQNQNNTVQTQVAQQEISMSL